MLRAESCCRPQIRLLPSSCCGDKSIQGGSYTLTLAYSAW